MSRLLCRRIRIAGVIFAAGVVVFEVVRVAMMQEVVVNMANGNLARHRAHPYSVDAVWAREINN
jgi:hypothetical protein